MFVADYVLMEYGTGAIMAVPAHDQRDYDFAVEFDLPIRQVVAPADGDAAPEHQAFVAHSENEQLINSGQFTGMNAQEGREAIVAWLDREGRGHPSVSYKLRDWLISRQRYWGCPIPIIYCERCGMVPVPEDELPGQAAGHRRLPAEGTCRRSPPPRTGSTPSAPTATARLGARPTRWTRSSTRAGTSCATATPATTRAAWDRRVVDMWMPVDQYIGGVEHAILHLMYSRFFVKALHDMELLGVRGAVPAPCSRRG